MDYAISDKEEQQELDERLAKIAQQNAREKQILNEIVTKITEQQRLEMIEKSCRKEEIPISGETYVNKQKDLKNKIKKGLLLAGAVVVMAATIHFGNIEEDASAVRQEVSQQVTLQNPIGGQFYKKSIYDDQFIDYIRDMKNIELATWLNDTKEEMKESWLEINDISQIVQEMQKDYLEEIQKGEVK